MTWRFSPSKYKNTAPKLPKKDGIIYDLPVGTLSCTNNAINVNSNFLAFLIDGEAGKIGVLPFETRGRKLHSDVDIIYAHSDSINDFCFLKFENFIATCGSSGEKLKIWSCDKFGDLNHPVSTSDFSCAIEVGQHSVRTVLECLAPHKTASSLLAVGSATCAPSIIDVDSERIVIGLDSKLDHSLSLDWSEDGSILIVSTNKGRNAMIFDPRAKSTPIFNLTLHTGVGRENRLIFADGNIVSSGFTLNRNQEILLYDSRDWSKPIQSEIFECSTGVLMPLYDSDSKLLFLAGKGASKFFLTELKSDKSKISRLNEQILPEQTLGACLSLKTSCDVMSGEVQRFHQLTKNSIIPIPCIVPRRSYVTFHDDLFPDTEGNVAGCTVSEWLSGSKNLPAKVSFKYLKDKTKLAINEDLINNITTAYTNGNNLNKKSCVEYQNLFVLNNEAESNRNPISFVDFNDKENSKNVNIKLEKNFTKENSIEPVPVTLRLRSGSNKVNTNTKSAIVDTNRLSSSSFKSARPKSCVVGNIQSRFRHVEVLAGTNKCIFSNLRNVNNRLPTESNGFCVSQKYAAIPLAGSAGIISIIEILNSIKIPDGVMDGIQNSSQVMDLQWNPFRSDELAVGLDNGVVNIWRIDSQTVCIGSDKFNEILKRQKEAEKGTPLEEYLKLIDLTPYRVLNIIGSTRVTQIRFHPTVSDLLAISLINGAIQLWNTKDNEFLIEIQGHSQGVLCLAWSTDGQKLASIGRDMILKVYEPLLGNDCCIAKAKVLESSRAARIIFVCKDSMILLVGFSRNSNRQCSLLQVDNLKILHTEVIDTNTQPLVPYYDYDTSVVFLTGKGDRTIQMLEICSDAPYFLRLSPTTFLTGHQSIALFQKNLCNVIDVEFACGWRLTEKIMEKLSFKIPRVKKELFQRDIFPHTLVSWEATSSVDEWKNGVLNSIKFCDLKPEGMQENINLIAEIPIKSSKKITPVIEESNKNLTKTPSYLTNIITEKKMLITNDFKNQIESSWSAQITKCQKKKIEQDDYEGIDESEWKS